MSDELSAQLDEYFAKTERVRIAAEALLERIETGARDDVMPSTTEVVALIQHAYQLINANAHLVVAVAEEVQG